VEQTINLKDEFGIDFKGFKSLREAIGEAVLNQIRTRTARGDGMNFRGIGGTPTKLKKPYSDEYIENLDFKAFGKSRGRINMTLTGDMLGLMDVKKQTGNSITIGWDDAEQNAKAYNHSSPVRSNTTVPYRPFFGVSKKELTKIKKQFGKEIKSAMRLKDDGKKKAFEERVAKLLTIFKDKLVDVNDG